MSLPARPPLFGQMQFFADCQNIFHVLDQVDVVVDVFVGPEVSIGVAVQNMTLGPSLGAI